MKRLLLLLVVTLITCVSCSKKITTVPFSGNWTGGYFANNIYLGTWNITIDNNGSITGKIISASGLPPSEFYVVGNVNSTGSITFKASISSTINLRFEGTLNNTVANGIWVSDSIPGNPPNKVWNGNKQ